MKLEIQRRGLHVWIVNENRERWETKETGDGNRGGSYSNWNQISQDLSIWPQGQEASWQLQQKCRRKVVYIDAKARQSRFKFGLHCLIILWPETNYFISLNFVLLICTQGWYYLVVLLLWLIKPKYVKHSKHNKILVNISSY